MQEPKQSYRLYPLLKAQGHSGPSLYLNKHIYFLQNILGCKTIAPQPARHAAPIRKNFCRKSKAAHEFTRQFAPLRATLILSARPDRIPTGYKAGHHMNSCSALTRSAPVPRPPRPRCANPQEFLQKEQSSTRIHAAIRATSRQFDTLRTHRQDIDRIQSRASHEFMPRFDPLCACAPPAATRCANPQKLLQKEQGSTRIHAAIRATSRHFDTLRTPRQDIDGIQSRASHEFMPRFDPLCASAQPAATTPAAFAQSPVSRLPSPVSRDAPRIFLPNLTKSLVPALLPVNPSNHPKRASAVNPI